MHLRGELRRTLFIYDTVLHAVFLNLTFLLQQCHFFYSSLLIKFFKECLLSLFFFKILFISRERGKEGDREGEKHQCVVASHMSHTGEPGLQPRHVPWLGIEPSAFQFTSQYSVHWATPIRALLHKFKLHNVLLFM